ncbi:MAG TPA: 3-deoxy-7-phosphoheptulonate synthase, partial [Capillimicrobium sp.]
MLIVMKQTATQDQVQDVAARVEGTGARARVIEGEEVTLIGAIGDADHERHVADLGLETDAAVDRVVPILKPYKLASSQLRNDAPSTLEIGGRRVG